MNRIIILLIIMWLAGFKMASAQSLGRRAISSTQAQSLNGAVYLSYTVGQSVSGTVDAGTLILTKGFQQPDPSINSFPVEWLSFTVVEQDKEALLQWTTASEQNSDHFVVERSIDGDFFQTIGEVKAAGFSQNPLHYSFIDYDLFRLGVEEVLYRLKQVDLDGQYEYSRVLSLRIQSTDLLEMVVFPNPATTSVEVQYQRPPDRETHLYLTDLHGKILYQTSIQNTVGIQHLNLGALARGMYILYLDSETDRLSQKLILK